MSPASARKSGFARVLFVSKPIAPPWNDGSKNLVRDVALNLRRARATVLTTPAAPSLGDGVTQEAVYSAPRPAGRFDKWRFSPSILSNARVLQRLLVGDPHDIWHFVFAPNFVSSEAARLAHMVRSTTGWRGKVVQTVASAPAHWGNVGRLLFGDVVVTLSEWTRGRLIGSGVDSSQLRVIPPCAAAPPRADNAKCRALRERLNLGKGPILLYPGDYEISKGAETVAHAVRAIVRAIPEARIVFACRAKTPNAAAFEKEIRARERADGVDTHTVHIGEVDDMPTLLSASDVILFPVDDLLAKVDLPIVLLEALALGIPMILARGGPLEAIDAARFVDPGDSDGLARVAVKLLNTSSDVKELRDHGKQLYKDRFRPEVVAAAHDALYADLFEEI